MVPQDLVRISQSIQSGEFYQLPPLVELCAGLRETGGTLHLVGLLGPGGVHALDRHLLACVELGVRHRVPAIAIHGFGRDGLWTSMLLGGSNRALASHVASHLTPALPDYEIVHDVEAIPTELRGLHPRNPVNLPRGGGVQIELPPRVRGTTPHWARWEGPGHPPPTEALVAGLAAAVQAWPA